MKNIAIIFAGGVGKRMNNNATPKQFLNLNDKPVIIHTLEHFEKHSEIDSIVVVCVETHINLMKELVRKYHLAKVQKVVEGGNSGQESIFNGLQAIKNMYSNTKDICVLIHDGVRPIINANLISENIKAVKQHGSAISSIFSRETIVLTKDNKIIDFTDRDQTMIARAPQSFYFDQIYDCHIKANTLHKYDFVDSCQLMLYFDHSVYTVLCDSDNIKITTPDDFYVAKALIEAKTNLEIMGVSNDEN